MPRGYGLPARPLVTADVPTCVSIDGSTRVTSSGRPAPCPVATPTAWDGANCTPTPIEASLISITVDCRDDTWMIRPTRPWDDTTGIPFATPALEPRSMT